MCLRRAAISASGDGAETIVMNVTWSLDSIDVLAGKEGSGSLTRRINMLSATTELTKS